jgi:hypothetical protein
VVGWWVMVHCGLFEQLKTCRNVGCYSNGSFSNDPRFTGILDGIVLFLKDFLEYWLLFE